MRINWALWRGHCPLSCDWMCCIEITLVIPFQYAFGKLLGLWYLLLLLEEDVAATTDSEVKPILLECMIFLIFCSKVNFPCQLSIVVGDTATYESDITPLPAKEEATCWLMPQKGKKIRPIQFKLGLNNDDNDKQKCNHSFVFVEYSSKSTIV